MTTYLVKTIPKLKSSWANKLRLGQAYLPVRAARQFSHVILIHGNRALIMKVSRSVKARPAEWCDPMATQPVAATNNLYLKRGGMSAMRLNLGSAEFATQIILACTRRPY